MSRKPLDGVACSGGVINDTGCVDCVTSCDLGSIGDEYSGGRRGHTIGDISGITGMLTGVGAMCSLRDIPISIAGDFAGE